MIASPPAATTAKLTKGRRTRRAILDAILAEANVTRPSEIKIADICARAKIATGAFYFHFAGREEALRAAATEVVTALFETVLALPPQPDLEREITGILSVFYQARVERPEAMRALYVILAEQRPVRMAWLDLRERLIARLAAAFERDGADGGFASTYVLAQFLLGALERFYDDVFFLPPTDRLNAEAASEAVFVHEQAGVWVRAARGGPKA